MMALRRPRAACGGVLRFRRPTRRAPAEASHRIHRHPSVRLLRRLRAAVRPATEGTADHTDVLLRPCPRGFFELADIAKKAGDGVKGNPISPIALEAVRRLDALFEIERAINGKAATERRTVRQEKSKPLLDDMQAWLLLERETLLRSDAALLLRQILPSPSIGPRGMQFDGRGLLKRDPRDAAPELRRGYPLVRSRARRPLGKRGSSLDEKRSAQRKTRQRGSRPSSRLERPRAILGVPSPASGATPRRRGGAICGRARTEGAASPSISGSLENDEKAIAGPFPIRMLWAVVNAGISVAAGIIEF